MTYNFCQKCFTRFEGCVDCHAAELAAKDKYIEAQDVIISGQRKEIEDSVQKLKCCGNCRWNLDADEEHCEGCIEPELERREEK